MTILAKNHYFLAASTDIDEILQPLKRFGVIHFTYLKNYLDGSQVYLSNNPRWIEDYYHLKLYKSSLYESNIKEYESGHSLWPENNDSPVLAHARCYFNSDHGITLIEKSDKCCEFYFFSGALEKRSLVDFYVNNLDVLKRFIAYFKNKSEKILKRAEEHKIKIPNHYNIIQADDLNKMFFRSGTLQEDRSAFFSETNVQQFVIGDTKLSRRELDCVTQLFQNKTTKEIANLLAISIRTVETHFEHIKAKLNCRNKSELLIKLSQFLVLG